MQLSTLVCEILIFYLDLSSEKFLELHRYPDSCLCMYVDLFLLQHPCYLPEKSRHSSHKVDSPMHKDVEDLGVHDLFENVSEMSVTTKIHDCMYSQCTDINTSTVCVFDACEASSY